MAAILLEAAGPLNLLLAQCVYLGQPLLGHPSAPEKWEALGHLLESQDASRQFAAFLRKEETI